MPTESEARIAAAIDVGSNSLHLLVAAIEAGRLRTLRDESVLLGLGSVVDLGGSIPASERAAAVNALVEYVAEATRHGAGNVTLMATEPLRRASDRSSFVNEVEAATGHPLHVLTHEEEAALTLFGVLEGVAPTEPTLVLDIGGGSTELILHGPGTDPVVGVIPVGSARLTAGFVEADPPTPEEIVALRAEARRLLAGMPAGHPTRGIVVGGSGINLLRLSAPDAEEEIGSEKPLIDHDRIERAMVLAATHPAAELVARFGLRERRARQMAAGVALIEATMAEYGLERMEASDASLREGAIIAVDRAGDAWRDRLRSLVFGIPSDGHA
ncbi:exopolyphosphatase [soil metagenome]